MASAEETDMPSTTSSACTAQASNSLSPPISSADAAPNTISRSASRHARRPSAGPHAAHSSEPDQDLH
eukprot:3157717-Pyramimonas_sp.AAC.1